MLSRFAIAMMNVTLMATMITNLTFSEASCSIAKLDSSLLDVRTTDNIINAYDNVTSRTECSIICLADSSGCVMMYFNHIDKVCQTHSGFVSPITGRPHEGGRFYVMQGNAVSSVGTVSSLGTASSVSTEISAGIGAASTVTKVSTTTTASGCPLSSGYSEETIAFNLCFKISTKKLSWHEARVLCKADGGDLIKIDSADKQLYIESLLTSPDTYFLGGTDIANEGTWRWADDTIVSNGYDNWAASYPMGILSTEDCMVIEIQYYNSKWIDAVCSVPEYFICEV